MVWIGWTAYLRFYMTGKSKVGLQHGFLSTNLPSPSPLLEAKGERLKLKMQTAEAFQSILKAAFVEAEIW
jgi:hypothetical protein